MILDARSLVPDALVSADVCIAGAGAAGITLARELLSGGLRVVLLESGDLEPEAATQGLYAGSVDTGGFAYAYSLSETRQRYFGGTTNHWGGWCRPLDPEDFEARSWIPRSGWPITREELSPSYHRAQSLCQIGSLDFDAGRLASLVGRPILPFDPARLDTIVYLMSPPTRFGKLYRDELAGAANLTVYLNANLVNIRLAPSGGTVESFECATLSGVTFRVAAARYVLALGGVENARMLLASNRQEPAGIGNRNDQVGRCFMEHPSSAYFWSAALVASTEFDFTFYTAEWTVDGVRVVPGLRLAPPLRAAKGLAGMSITLADAGVVDGSSVTGRISPRQVSRLLRSSGPTRLLQAAIRGEQRPGSENRLTLRSDRDALGVPKVHLRLTIEPRDVADLARDLELMACEIGRIGLGRLWMPVDASGQLNTGLEGGAHHMGSTRMAASPEDGVVDADCRVNGLPNLYIAGSSVFPTGGFANPTLTIVALAIRLADHLKAAS